MQDALDEATDPWGVKAERVEMYDCHSGEWNFLFYILKLFNFGESIIRWVKTFYSNCSACVLNYGMSTGFFS